MTEMKELTKIVRRWRGRSVGSELELGDHGRCTSRCPLYEPMSKRERIGACKAGTCVAHGDQCVQYYETIDDLILQWECSMQQSIEHVRDLLEVGAEES